MITTRFSLCALPRTIWEQRASLRNPISSIRTLVEDALAIEQRIQRGMGQSQDRAHYNLCCIGIESAVTPELLAPVTTAREFGETLGIHRLPIITLSADYLHILAQIVQQTPFKAFAIRLGAMFFPPDTIEDHNIAFCRLTEQSGVFNHTDVQRRVAFFQLAHHFDCGVIELQNTFQYLATVEPVQLVPLQADSKKQQDSHLTEAKPTHRDELDPYGTLRTQIQHAIHAILAGRIGEVNFSNHPHHIITEVLHEFIYKDEAEMGRSVSIQVIYDDNSRGESFPLYCLPRRTKADLAGLDPSQTLQVALMSPRHLGIGGTAEVVEFKNHKTSRPHTLADADTFCYRLTRKQLQETRSEGNLRLYLCQTTFQAAVIGFYRALVQELQHRADSPATLEVTPFYFSRKIGYWSGRSWN